MNHLPETPKKSKLRLSSILRARCPACQTGGVLKGIFSIQSRCTHCDYDFHPEPGFYLGAMCVGYLATATLTIPPTIALKVLKVDTSLLIAFPILEFLFVGTLLIIYSRIFWLHLEFQMSDRLDGNSSRTKDKPRNEVR